jgi:hypothetical protein
MRGLSVLYPPEHGIIELVAIKKDGSLISARFTDREKLVDEIAKYDGREDTAAIYTAINRLDEGTFQRDGRVLTVDESLASGPRVNSGNVARVTGILFDIDPFRANGDKKDSTTESEHQAAIEAADFLKHKLSLVGWPEPVMGSSGNGAALRYICDLPASEETTNLLSRMLKAANGMLPEKLAAQVEVDPAVFDLPRISKVFGTMTRKGPGTTERPHRRSSVISAPEKLEPVNIDCLIKLAGSGKRQDEQGPQRERTEKVEPLSPDAAERLQELFAADPIFKADLCTPAPMGTRSDAEFHLCARLWEAGFNEAEIYSIMTSSPQTKWLERGGSYRWDTIEKAVAKAEANHGTGAKDAPSEILERIKADPRALKEPAILAVLAALKVNDPIEYDLLVDAIKKAHKGLKVDTIHALIDKYIQESEKTKEKPPETPKSIVEKARAIAERGDPFKYAIWQAQRNHLGDIDYQKVLIASIASAASQTSNGIQPGGNGDKGSGKSDACAATYHLVPMDRRLDGSLSPMSLFYLQEMGRLRSGMILFSDDVEYDGIIPIYKRSTARFQHGITHFSVSGGKDRKGIELIVPPRMVWWLTSVESVANEQAFDRQYPISTDSSAGHKKRVSREIADRRARKELRLAEDEGIEVARAIIADIFDNGPFKVLVPQSTKSMWLKVADFRGQEQFWDLVDALVILRWRQHKQDVDGWLIAEDKDLIEAKGILTGHKVAHFADLTEAEAKLVGVMSSGHSMTQKELTEALSVAQSTLSERLRSIMAKSAIITEDYDQGKKIYALNPKMQLGADYWGGLDLIDLKIDNNEAYRSQKIALSGCYRYVIGLPIGIIINNSNRIPSSLSVNVGESMARDTRSCEKCLGWEESIPSSILISAKTTDNDQKQQQEPLSDTDKPPKTEPARTDNDSNGGPDIPIRQAGGAVDEKAPTSGPNPRKDAPIPPKKLNATTKEKVRIIKQDGYRTQIPSPDNPGKFIDHLYSCGEVVEQEHWKACDLIKRDIAEAVKS